MPELLRDADLQQLVNVRTAPGSRHNPEIMREAMTRVDARAGVDYRWERRLVGWRRDPPDSPHESVLIDNDLRLLPGRQALPIDNDIGHPISESSSTVSGGSRSPTPTPPAPSTTSALT